MKLKRGSIKRSLAFVLALTLLFSETTGLFAATPEVNETEFVETLGQDVSAEEEITAEEEEISEEVVLEEEAADEELPKLEITGEPFARNFYYGIWQKSGLPIDGMELTVTDASGEKSIYTIGDEVCGFSGYDFFDYELLDIETGEPAQEEFDSPYYPAGTYKLRIEVDGLYAETDITVKSWDEIDKVYINPDTGKSNDIFFEQAGFIEVPYENDSSWHLPYELYSNYFTFEAEENAMYKLVADEETVFYCLYNKGQSYDNDRTVISNHNQTVAVMVSNIKPGTTVYVEKYEIPTAVEITQGPYATHLYSGIFEDMDSFSLYGMVITVTDKAGTKTNYTVGDDYLADYSGYEFFDWELTDTEGKVVYPEYDEILENSRYPIGTYNLRIGVYGLYDSIPIEIEGWNSDSLHEEVIDEITGKSAGVTFSQEGQRKIPYKSEPYYVYRSLNRNYFKFEAEKDAMYKMVADKEADFTFYGDGFDDGNLFVSHQEQTVVVEVKNKNPDTTVYVEKMKKPVKLEIAEDSDTPKMMYGQLSESRVALYGTRLKVTYDDNSTEILTHKDIWDTSFDGVDISYERIDGTYMYDSNRNYLPGEYKRVYTYAGVSCWEYITVKGLDDVTDILKLNGEGVKLAPNTTQHTHTEDGKTNICYTIHECMVYKEHLDAGTYSLLAETSATTEIVVYDKQGSRIDSLWLYSNGDKRPFSVDKAGDYYFLICVMDKGQTAPSTIYLKSQNSIKKAEIVSGPRKNKIIRGFEEPSIVGISIKVTFDDGTVVTTNEQDENWNLVVKDWNIYVDGKEWPWSARKLCPVGKIKLGIELSNGEILYIDFTVVNPTFAGKLNVGGSINLKATTIVRQENGHTHYESGAPNIVPVNLVAGQTYHIYASGDKSGSPEIELIDTNYSQCVHTYSYNGTDTGFIYTAPVTGTYYISEQSSVSATLVVEDYAAIEEVEVERGLFQNTFIFPLSQEFLNRWEGIILKVTFANGETEYIDYADDLWSLYGFSLHWINLDTKEIIERWDIELTGNYGVAIEIPGYTGDIIGSEKLKLNVVSLESAACQLNTKVSISFDEESSQNVIGTALKVFPVKAGTKYFISGNKVGYVVIYKYTDMFEFTFNSIYTNYVSQGMYYSPDRDGYIVLLVNPDSANVDHSESYVMVEEASKYVTKMTASFTKESEEIVFGNAPSLLDAEITLTYNDDTSVKLSYADFNSYGVTSSVMVRDGDIYRTPVYKVINGYNYLAPGTYYFTFGVAGLDVGCIASDYPIIVRQASTYSVVFNSNFPDGSTNKSATQKITYNKATALKANGFKATGYEFIGWTTEAKEAYPAMSGAFPEGMKLYKDKETVTNLSSDGKTVNLYAVWRLASYTISYHLSGGEMQGDLPGFYAYGTKVAAPGENNVKPMTGFDFAGWYMDAKYSKPATDITEQTTGNVDYYAKWTPAAYTIEFTSEGSDPRTQKVFYGVDAVLNKNTFKNKGLAFMGWAFGDAPEAVVLSDKATVDVSKENLLSKADADKKITLVAVWKKDFTVTLNADGGTIAEGKDITAYTYGDKVTLPTPVRTGYSFSGWYNESNVKVKSITAKTSGDLNLTAAWKANTYTIQFDANGGKGKTGAIKAQYDVEVELTKNAFTRAGYTFAGWTVQDGTEYTDLAKVKNLAVKGKVVLKAKWNQETYTISYDSMGGNVVPAATGHKYGSIDVTLPTEKDVTREGYEFKGWYKDTTFKTQMKESNIKSIAANITLYAKWVTKYTVKFDGNGATSGSMKDLSCTYSTAKALTANSFKKTGYAFAGWAVTKDGVAVLANKEKISTPYLDESKVLTLYAVWRNEFSIEYRLGEEEYLVSDAPVSYTYGTALTLPTAIKEGYSLAGWYSDAKLSKKASVTKTTSGDLILYPKWTGLKYTVVFNVNAPEGAKTSGKMKNQSLSYGTTKALTKNSFKATGYTFKGWSTSKDGEVKFPAGAKISDHSDELLKIYDMGSYKSTLNLYAVWEAETYTVTYAMGGVVEDVTETYTVEDGGYTLINEPARAGYTFMGFYQDKKFKKKATNLKAGTTGNKTIYAKWVAYK